MHAASIRANLQSQKETPLTQQNNLANLKTRQIMVKEKKAETSVCVTSHLQVATMASKSRKICEYSSGSSEA